MNTSALYPTTVDEAIRMAEMHYKSSVVKAKFRSVHDAFTAMCAGIEIGLPPLQSLQNIIIMKNTICMEVDGMLALVQASGEMESFNEYFTSVNEDTNEETTTTPDACDFNEYTTAVCKIKRKKQVEQTSKFSVDDAKRAGLWAPSNKNLPWAAYPLRMLSIRARGFALRNAFSDLLKGIKPKEEVADYKDLSTTKEKQPKKAIKKVENEGNEESKEIENFTPSPLKYSDLLHDSYFVDEDSETVIFKSGAEYSLTEMNAIRDLPDDDKIREHTVRVAKGKMMSN